jgi:cysteine desulfurase/selenocysteine lyase
MDAITSTRPLDRLSDFPAIPQGWAYLDTAATAQKPRAVIDAITRGYSETYATVHRGVYQPLRRHDSRVRSSRRRTAPSSARRCRKK